MATETLKGSILEDLKLGAFEPGDFQMSVVHSPIDFAACLQFDAIANNNVTQQQT